MNYTETLSWIHGTERFGSRLGLGRMGRLLHRMGDPHLKVPFLHVAGTNGKGSTTTLIASALTAGGFKTGKFISPYILEFRERMQIDGQMIPEETLAALATRLRPIAEEFKAAGDTFNAVLAVRLAEGEELREAGVAANEAAAQSVAVRFVLPSIPQRG